MFLVTLEVIVPLLEVHFYVNVEKYGAVCQRAGRRCDGSHRVIDWLNGGGSKKEETPTGQSYFLFANRGKAVTAGEAKTVIVRRWELHCQQ